MLQIYRRHYPPCPYTTRRHRRCKCPIWVQGSLGGKVADLRVRLTTSLRADFERATEKSKQRLDDAVAPYARFVNAEERRSNEARDTLKTLREQTAAFLGQLARAETSERSLANPHR